MEEVEIKDLEKGFYYKVGDRVVIETKHMGPWEGHVSAVDPDGSIVVQHQLHQYPSHPSGATYVNSKHLGTDVTLIARARAPEPVLWYNNTITN